MAQLPKQSNIPNMVRLLNADGNITYINELDIKESVEKFIGNEFNQLINKNKYDEQLKVEIKNKVDSMEQRVLTFIDYKFAEVAERMVDMLINRKFEEEIEKRVKIKMQQRGKF